MSIPDREMCRRARQRSESPTYNLPSGDAHLGHADVNFGMGIHTFIAENEQPEDRVFPKFCRRIQFLRWRILDDLQEAAKLFVYKAEALLADEEPNHREQFWGLTMGWSPATSPDISTQSTHAGLASSGVQSTCPLVRTILIPLRKATSTPLGLSK